MAARLGYMSIDEIAGDTLTGHFTSTYSMNVGTAYAAWGSALLYFAWIQSGKPADTPIGRIAARYPRPDWFNQDFVKELEQSVEDVTFQTPNTPSTRFLVRVCDPDLLAGLHTSAWEDYYFG